MSTEMMTPSSEQEAPCLVNFNECVFNASPGNMVLVDPKPPWRLIAVTDDHCIDTHTRREDLVGKALFVAHPDPSPGALGAKAVRESLFRVLATRQPQDVHMQRYDSRTAKGDSIEERYWTAQQRPVISADGKLVGIIQSAQDTTEYVKNKHGGVDALTRELMDKTESMTLELKQRDTQQAVFQRALQVSERALEATRARLNLALRSARVGTWAFGLLAQSFSFDYDMNRLFGLPRENIVTLGSYADFLRVIEPEDAAAFPPDKLDASSAHLLTDHEFRVRWPDGSLHYISFRGEQLSSDQLAGIALDLTNQKLLEQERLQALQQRAEALAELDRQKTVIFNNISHEFRTPLTLIIGGISDSLVDESEPLTQKQKQRHLMALRNAQRLLRQVNQILTLASSQSSTLEMYFAPTDLSKLTAEVASMFRSLMESAGVELICHTPPLNALVYVDHKQYETILYNLLSNAYKFTLHGTVNLSLTRSSDDYVSLVVSDTGVGIAAHDFPKLFDRFHRGIHQGSRSFEGSGLGLPLVRELVELHGGTIQVHSEEGKGSTFTLSFRLGSDHLPPDKIREDASYSTGTVSSLGLCEASSWNADTSNTPSLPRSVSESAGTTEILVVDDNSDMRSYITDLLSPLGHVSTLPNGHAALAYLEHKLPHVIILDVMMPGLNGLDVLQHIKSRKAIQHIPVLLLSARADEQSRVSGLEKLADDYIAKPFSSRELVTRVAAFLALGERRQQLVDELAQRTKELEESNARVLEQEREQLRTESVLLAEQERAKTLEVFNKKQEVFMDTLCHELRNPLNGIIGTGDLLTDRFASLRALFQASPVAAHSSPDSVCSECTRVSTTARALIEECSVDLKTICDCSGQTRIILDDALDLSKLENSKVVLNRVPTQPIPLVERAISMFSSLAKQKEIAVELRASHSSGWISLDSHRLSQIIINLLSNAIKFTPQGGRVTFVLNCSEAREGEERSSASPRHATSSASATSSAYSSPSSTCSSLPRGTLHLQVTDTGIGIAPDELSRLFDRFSQANLRVGATYGGSGLGLHISKSLAQLMGGDLTVTSTLGKGTTFMLSIPYTVCSPQVSPSAEERTLALTGSSAVPSAARSSLTILIVEDNRINQKLLRNMLRKGGYPECDVAEHGDEAVQRCHQKAYDFIFMDVEMPIRDGISATREIRRLEESTQQRRAAIVGVSGHTSERRIAEAIDAGMDDYITKPFSTERVLHVVHRFAN